MGCLPMRSSNIIDCIGAGLGDRPVPFDRNTPVGLERQHIFGGSLARGTTVTLQHSPRNFRRMLCLMPKS